MKKRTMMKRVLGANMAVAVLALVFLFGCTTTDPYTGEKKISKTTWGTAIGAATGAAVGAATGDHENRGERALIGAGIGALAGGAAGKYMDNQEAKLRARLQGTGVSVTRMGDNIILNMPGNVTFKTDSADINAGFYEVLNSVAIVLKEFNKTMIEISGHTDSVGSDAYNLTLSQKRAESVGQYLVSQGIVSTRVIPQGFGESRPIASNDTEQGRQQNRRVEIKLIPVTSN